MQSMLQPERLRTLSYLPGLLADLPQLWHGHRGEVHGLQLLPQLRLPLLQLCLPRCIDVFRGICAVGGSAAPGAQRRPTKQQRTQQRSAAIARCASLSCSSPSSLRLIGLVFQPYIRLKHWLSTAVAFA